MTLEAETQQLRSSPLFDLFDAEALRLIAFSSDTRPMKDEEVLFREGEVSDGAYFVVSGQVGLAAGEREEICGPASLIGEAALFAETQRPATATARGNAVVRRIPRHLMRRVLSAYPGAAMRIQAYLHEKIVSVGDSLARVETLLLEDDGAEAGPNP